jgi:TRAP-type C4-dicarboxylate transport system substrate-binding protein
LRGFKMRVPPSPISLAIFQGLGCSPITINSAELYTSLQTHVADGQENALGDILTQKIYQVQKYIAITDHMWVAFWILVNAGYWNSLPADVRKVIADAFEAQALEQRAMNQKLDQTAEVTLRQAGLIINRPDKAAFQAVLAKSGFYKTWKEKFGPQVWSALEKYAGPLG